MTIFTVHVFYDMNIRRNVINTITSQMNRSYHKNDIKERKIKYQNLERKKIKLMD
jgi:hypothetical protein